MKKLWILGLTINLLHSLNPVLKFWGLDTTGKHFYYFGSQKIYENGFPITEEFYEKNIYIDSTDIDLSYITIQKQSQYYNYIIPTFAMVWNLDTLPRLKIKDYPYTDSRNTSIYEFTLIPDTFMTDNIGDIFDLRKELPSTPYFDTLKLNIDYNSPPDLEDKVIIPYDFNNLFTLQIVDTQTLYIPIGAFFTTKLLFKIDTAECIIWDGTQGKIYSELYIWVSQGFFIVKDSLYKEFWITLGKNNILVANHSNTSSSILQGVEYIKEKTKKINYNFKKRKSVILYEKLKDNGLSISTTGRKKRITSKGIYFLIDKNNQWIVKGIFLR